MSTTLCQCGHSRERHQSLINNSWCAACDCKHFTPADSQADNDPTNGVWFVSECSGMLYRIPGAAGDIAEIRVNGKRYTLAGRIDPQSDQPAGGEACSPLWTREACQGYLNRAASAEGFIQSLTIPLGIGNGYEPVEWEKITESASELHSRIATLEREKAELTKHLRDLVTAVRIYNGGEPTFDERFELMHKCEEAADYLKGHDEHA